MKAKIEFDLDDEDDKASFQTCIQARKYCCALSDIREYLRGKSKYGEYQHEETAELIDRIYEEYFNIIHSNGIVEEL